MTAFLVTLVVTGSVAGDLLKAHAMRLQGVPEAASAPPMLRLLLRAFRSSWFLLSLGAYAGSFFAFMALLSFREVSFAVPATAIGFVFETALARVCLSERVGPRRWAGAALVIVGVCLIA